MQGFKFFAAFLGLTLTMPFLSRAGKAQETQWLSNVRQLTFDGRRSGEGYFGPKGRWLVFQSEREADNPFYQIYLMDRETGDTERISPGFGKTTCAWIHPDQNRVLFASTHGDPDSKRLQEEELEFRRSGKKRRYAWDYDPQFELYAYDRSTRSMTQLTQAEGYDAEGSYSPDGQLVAFASNRRAYDSPMSPSEAEAFKLDPAVMNDIYIMRADGTDVRRLTETLGYDGGPFFSPDGQRICWRRFAPNGATAEVMSMNIDGSDKMQLTKMDAMSWAPYYHPSGQYLIFTTNINGFENFELYVVDAQGRRPPLRITETGGFDGLPTFTPDGKKLAWTSNRNAAKRSQIYLADWNHEAVLKALQLEDEPSHASAPEVMANKSMAASRADFLPTDIMRHVDYLCRPELAGRMTGSAGEKLATSYVAAIFDHLGLEPAGSDGWFQPFTFTAGVDLGTDNRLSSESVQYALGRDWQPLSFSKTGEVESAGVVFAGYGIAAPKDGSFGEYDSFAHLDVEDKWILAFRFMPEDISAEQRQHLSRHSSLRFKAMVARDKNARGLILVSGPRSKVKNQLIQLRFDGSLSGTSIPVISITDELAQSWLTGMGKDLATLQQSLDSGEPQFGFEVEGIELGARIDIRKVSQEGRNVVGRLPMGKTPSSEAILIGAHIDHLGAGANSSSLAREDEKTLIHFGADDNASGVAGMLEIAEYLVDQKRQGNLPMKRDVIFAAWSGEELGLIGSNQYANAFAKTLSHTAHHSAAHHPAAPSKHAPPSPSGDDASKGHPHQPEPQPHSLYPALAACLNMDMIGRFEKQLVLQGVGSSTMWKSEIERRNVPVGLPITLQDDSYLPTDASTFFMRGVPILSAFTGSHSDYHTPRDTPDKLNYEAAAKIARFMGLVARSLSIREEAPEYVAQTGPKPGEQRARLRAYLGTIPDYAEGDVKGLKLSGVAKDGPAAQGGLKAGDLIVQLGGRKIENIYDYTYAIEALKIGQPVKIVVLRNKKEVTLTVIPGSRE